MLATPGQVAAAALDYTSSERTPNLESLEVGEHNLPSRGVTYSTRWGS